MNNSLPASPSSTEVPPTKLRQYFRFTLRTWVIVILLAATAGLVAHTVLRVVNEDRKMRLRESEIYKAAQYLRPNHYAKYHESVGGWYEYSAGNEFVSRDAVDLIMRKAARLQNPDTHLKELERIAGARREGDAFLVYSVSTSGAADEPTNSSVSTLGNAEKPDLSAPSDRYAFLVRNDLVIFFAERKPTDAGWVERSVGSSYIESFHNNLNLLVIPGAMFGVVLAFFGVRVLVGLFRYFMAPPVFLAAGSKKPEVNLAKSLDSQPGTSGGVGVVAQK
jgi:hypothetical protein